MVSNCLIYWVQEYLIVMALSGSLVLMWSCSVGARQSSLIIPMANTPFRVVSSMTVTDWLWEVSCVLVGTQETSSIVSDIV